MKEPVAATATIAACSLGGVRFAVAMDDVVQLLSCPADLAALPRREGALLGAFTLRGEVVPIVDLRRWLPWPGEPAATPTPTPTPTAPALVLVVQQGGGRVAVGIDQVDGLHRVSAGGVQQVAHDDAGDEVFGAVVRLVRGTAPASAETVLGLLDVAALMRLSKVWARSPDPQEAVEPTLQPQAGEPPAPTRPGAGRAFAILESEGELLAIPAAHVRSVLPMPALQPLWGGDPNRPGVARWRGRDVPVLRLLPSLGIATAGVGPAPLLAVVEHDGVCIGIPVQAVREVRVLDVEAAQTMQSLGLAPSPILPGLLTRPDGGRALLVDVPELMRADPLAALSRAPDPGEATRSAGTQAHVVVQAGTPWALRISDLREVIELPEAWEAGQDAATPWHHTWRQNTMPTWDLRALKGHGPTQAGADTRVLVLQSGAWPIGLVVEAVLHLLPARTSELLQYRRPDGRMLPFVVHRDGEAQRSFAVLGASDWPRGEVH